MKNRSVFTVIKGMIVGGTMLVPGVSGGSMAMILGIYDKLVSSVSSFAKHKRESLIFLGQFSLGGGLGMLLFARPILGLIERFPMPMLYFFLGAVAGGVPLILREAKVTSFSFREPAWLALGLLAVFGISCLPEGLFAAEMAGAAGFLFLMAAGVAAAAALVLPGISVSYLFLVLGIYDELMCSISTLRLSFLVPLALGLLLGVVLTTRVLETAMNRHPQPTYLMILGFVFGSMAEVFPGIPSGTEFLVCLAALAAGFGVIRLITASEGNEK